VSRRNRGVVQHLLEDYPAAMANLVRAHKLYAKLGDLAGAADAIQAIGAVQCATGDYADATANLSAVLALCTETGDRLGAANARLRLGIVAHLTNDYPTAVSDLARAYAVFAEVGSRQGKADALSYLGLVHGMAGDHSPALRNLVQATAAFEDLGDRGGAAITLCRLAHLLRILGRYREAVRTGEHAHALFVELGSAHGQAKTLCDLAMARYLGGEGTPGDHKEAIGTLEEALALSDRLCATNVHNYLGVLQHLAGDCHAATESLGHALELCAENRDSFRRAETLNNLGALAWDWPEAGDAYSHHEQALALAREIGAQFEEARALEGMGNCLVRDCHAGNGHAYLREALTRYQRLGVPRARVVRARLAALG
jgi:tetratricopeptide (TPR) repeat protein